MNKYRFTFGLLLIFWGFNLHSQNSRLDSLEKIFNNTFIDSIRIELLLQMSDLDLKQNPKKAESYALQAIEIATYDIRENNYGKGLIALGKSQYQQQRFKEALASFERAMILFSKLQVYDGVSESLNNIGSTYQKLENFEAALTAFFESIRISDSLHLIAIKAVTLQNVGNTYAIMGKMADAETYYLESLRIRERIGDESEIAASYMNMAAFYGQKEEYDLSLQYSARAKGIKEKIGDKRSLIQLNHNEGNVYSRKGEIDKAYISYSESSRLSEETGYRPGLAANWMGIGILFRTAKNYPRSLEYLKRALEEYLNQGNKLNTARCLENIGLVQFGLDSIHLENYFEYFLKSDSIYRNLNNIDGINRVASNIGTMYWKKGDYQKAIPFLERSIAVDIDRGSPTSAMFEYLSLGKCYMKMDNLTQAESYLKLAYKYGKESKNKSIWSGASLALSELYEKQKKDSKALEKLKESNILNDSILGSTVQNSIYEGEIKKEKEQAVLQTISHENEKRTTIIEIAVVFILVITAIFSLLWYRKSKEQTAVRLQWFNDNNLLAESIKQYKAESDSKAILPLTISTTDGIENINLDDLMYVEAQRNYIHFVPVTGPIIRKRVTLKDVAQILNLPGVFERVGKSYIINLSHISQKSNWKVTMKNGVIIGIGKEYREAFEKYFDESPSKN